MSERWFISDTHLGHRGILSYEAKHRPFSTLEEHDEAIIENWNNLIRDDDKVFHLGDFCLNRRSLSMAKRLKGRKVLVMGNHDTFRPEEYIEAGFIKLCGALQFENMILTHVPVHSQQLEYRFFANVHGHLHSHSVYVPYELDKDFTEGRSVIRKADWRYLNVGLEHTALKPITLEEVYSRIMEAKEKSNE